MEFMSLDPKSESRKLMVTVLGSPGLGKTSLAAKFPKPFFLRTEDGLKSLDNLDTDARASQLIERTNDGVQGYDLFMDQLRNLYTQEHNFETLVIDSVTRLHSLIEAKILSKDPSKNMASCEGGFHQGYKVAAKMHMDVFEACEKLRKHRNMYIIFIGHISTDNIVRPDGVTYSTYAIDLHKDSKQVYISNVDIVGFIKANEYETMVGDKSVLKSKGGLSIQVTRTPDKECCKNRLNIEHDLPFEFNTNPFAEYL